MTDPWERQPYETHQAFEAFALYRDQGVTRSAGKVARALGKSTTLIERWCSRWSWVDRAGQWDAKLDRDSRQEQEHAVRDMMRRQATEAASIQRAALSPMLALLERIRSRGGDVAALQAIPDDELLRLQRPAARAYLDGARLERLARGLPEGSVELEVHGDLLLGVASARDLLRARLDAMSQRLGIVDESEEPPALEAGEGGTA